MKESDFPQSAEEAREHIRRIRSDKGLGDGPDQIGNNAADLEAALRILSNDLYQTSTHFLLELIQNADDNAYDAASPALSITYDKGWVRVDCNERGFARRNVEAICRICHSTKSGRSKSAGFVGEKGIGFKAVFKVASSVWISSGHYAFRFDRDAHLGMIAPVWDAHPGLNRSAGSSILLKLDPQCDEDRVIDEMRSYDERSLLFLRRLRRLDITVMPRPGSTQEGFETRLCREGASSELASTMVLTRNGEEKHYFVWRHQAETFKDEPLRPGITTSEIVLAFPYSIEEDGRLIPGTETQHAYAFLPIRDTGFNFLLQADFLLSADRGDVRLDLAWNQTLARDAARAFVEAALHMGGMANNLRYYWIAYLPVNTVQRGFFADVRDKILLGLCTSPVLRDWTGKPTKPGLLTRVPALYCDDKGAPLTLTPRNAHRLLNGGYPEPHVTRLADLEVGEMGLLYFTEALGEIPWAGREAFLAGKTPGWHAAFARAVMAPGALSAIPTLPLIPLRSGSWVATGRKVYFSRGLWLNDIPRVPEGIEVDVVDDDAAADPDRRALYARLGVQDITAAFIRDAISATHSHPDFDARRLSDEVLISHGDFFRRTHDASRPGEPHVLWMVSETGCRHMSDRMYLSSDVPGSASRLLRRTAADGNRFLHPAYTAPTTYKERDSWLGYLQESMKVSVYPRFADHARLVGTTVDVCPLHDDFQTVMREQPGNAWLTLLRDGWDYYKKWLLDDMGVVGKVDRDRLIEHLSGRKVRVTGSDDPVELRSTHIALSPLTGEHGHVAPFVDIPDPHDPRWAPVLSRFGVGSEPDVLFYLACLNGAKQNEKISLEEMRRIMHKVEVELDGADSTKVHDARERVFKDKLVHIPARGGGRGSWVSQLDCFWRGAPWLTQSACLERHYPDLEALFRRHLNVPNASVDHYIREARAIHAVDRPALPHIKRLLVAFAVQHSAGYIDDAKREEIRELQLFPVVPLGSEVWCLVAATSEKPWLIADREDLRTQFRDCVPLLAFDGAFVLKIRELLKALGMESRFLSQSATSVTETVGEAVFNEALTQRYRARGKYFFRLTPEDNPAKRHIRAKFSAVNVFAAPRIVQFWHATLGLQRVDSEPADGSAFLESDAAGNLRVYVRQGHEADAYPHELVEHLRMFFGVAAEHRDLIAAAITADEEVVEKLFEARGVAPLLDEGIGEMDEEEDEFEEDAEYTPMQFLPEASKASRPNLGGDSRFARLLGSTRFAPAFFKNGGSSANLPSYDTVLDRSAHNAIGRPMEPRATSSAVTLAALQGELSKLEFVKKEDAQGIVLGKPVVQPSFFDKFRSKVQHDSAAAEAMVSDILGAVLGPQYDKATMWNSQWGRRKGKKLAAFRFSDTQGRFGAFLMRLEGLPGSAQGYTRLVYHLDVKVFQGGAFELSQDELDRARRYSVHSQPNPEECAPTKDVAVLATISDLRTEPQIRFLTDPWDLYQDNQLLLKSRTTYRASLSPRVEKRPAPGGETGFDAIQIRERTDGEGGEEPPGYGKGRTGVRNILGKGR